MALRINSEAPNFTAETTQGTVNFHDWIGNGWAILFSHPKDFTPVCTTELGYMAKIEPEFEKIRASGARLVTMNTDALDADSRREVVDQLATEMGRGRVRVLLHSVAFGNLIASINATTSAAKSGMP